MTWPEAIDTKLSTLSNSALYPDNLTLNQSLRTALSGVERQSTSDTLTFYVVRMMTDTAIDPMVTDLAHTGHPHAHLLGAFRGWRDHPHMVHATSDILLRFAGGYYRESEHYSTNMVGAALSSAAYMMTRAYPIDYESPIRPRPETLPLKSDLADMAGMFAVVSQVHATECGPEKNQAAVEALAQTITQITARVME